MATSLPDTVRDVVYTAVGLGVLTAQRVQVRRRELHKQLQPKVKDATASGIERLQAGGRELQRQLQPTVEGAAVRLQDMAGSIDQRVDPVLDEVQHRLPSPGRELLAEVRGMAKNARDGVLSKLGPDASSRKHAGRAYGPNAS